MKKRPSLPGIQFHLKGMGGFLGAVLCLFTGIGLAGVFLLAGCGDSGPPGVTFYCDQDKTVGEALRRQIESQLKIPVKIIYATPEDLQTGMGLSRKLMEEGTEFKADIYWASSPLSMIKMLDAGLLEGMNTAATNQFSHDCIESNWRWIGLGSRVRVLLYNAQTVSGKRIPKSVAALASPDWKGRCAMADPRTNSSARYHVLALFAVLQDKEATNLLRQMKANEVQFLADDNAVLDAVANGKADWGVVDSDIAWNAVAAKKPVKYVIADQVYGSTAAAMHREATDIYTVGTPLIPAPLALFKNRPARVEGKKMFDALVSTQMAISLARWQPGRFPTHQSLQTNPVANTAGAKLDPSHLEVTKITSDQIRNLQPILTLRLNEILGAHP